MSLFQTNVIKAGNPRWLPESVRRKVREQGRLTVSVSLSRAEKRRSRRNKKLPTSEWVEKPGHRNVTEGNLPGPWRNSVTPWLVGPMDALSRAFVRELVFCAGPQCGKSELGYNHLGQAIDQDPGPAMYISPDETTGKDNIRDRIIPMIQSSPKLMTYTTGVADDLTVQRVKLSHMPFYLGWATSPSRLASKPVKHLIFDEVDKYPQTSGKAEADPISLGLKRANTYRHDYKALFLSTPTTEKGNIWKRLKACRARFSLWVYCPECGSAQQMSFDRIKWPKDERDPERIEEKKLAWYECAHCDARWDDTLRDRSVAACEWRDEATGLELNTYLDRHRPMRVGFHFPAWYSRFIPLSECAAVFLRGQIDKTVLKDFCNAYKAEPWKDYAELRPEKAILALVDDNAPEQIVPRNTALLEISIDTQMRGFWYRVRAWGYGLTEDSVCIRKGYVETFAALEEIIDAEYYDADGVRYAIHGGMIDSGGGKEEGAEVSRTAEVYDWCVWRRNILPIKGQRRQTQPLRTSPIDFYPGTNKAIPGGLTLYNVHITYYKNKLHHKLATPVSDPGALRMHSATLDAEIEHGDYAKQMVAEVLDEKTGYWECPKGRDNHYWDVETYGLAYVDLLRVKYWQPTESMQQAPSGRRIRSEGVRV